MALVKFKQFENTIAYYCQIWQGRKILSKLKQKY